MGKCVERTQGKNESNDTTTRMAGRFSIQNQHPRNVYEWDRKINKCKLFDYKPRKTEGKDKAGNVAEKLFQDTSFNSANLCHSTRVPDALSFVTYFVPMFLFISISNSIFHQMIQTSETAFSRCSSK